MSEELTILVHSLVASRSKEPVVQLVIGDRRPVQLPAQQAREVALNILSAAEAAEFDAALYRGLADHGFSEQDVARILVLVRGVRERDEG